MQGSGVAVRKASDLISHSATYMECESEGVEQHMLASGA